MKMSALMPVYYKESPEFLRQALESMVAQTLQADEIIIVQDGPIGKDLNNVITEYCDKLPIVIMALDSNMGIGPALSAGVIKCQGPLIVRVDSDDICLPMRFEIQSRIMVNNPDIDVIGGAIAEFDSDPNMPVAVRRLPSTNNAIRRYAKSRTPMNHMTVMFRKQAVLNAGNYQPFVGFEDYHLWVRMLMSGSKFLNMDDILVLARVGNGMLTRRSGLKYLLTEIEFERYLYKSGYNSVLRSVLNITMYTPIRLAPAKLRQYVYRKFLRSTHTH